MERIQRALKVRIYPSKTQKEFLDKTLGSCRFIYNKMLAERILKYEELKNDVKSLYGYKYTTEKQWKEKYEFLKEVDSFALQQARRNLESAYGNFYQSIKGLRKGEKVGFPKFKSKRCHIDSYRTAQTVGINWERRELKIPKCFGLKFRHSPYVKPWFKAEGSEIKNVTISRSPTGKYYASILFEGSCDYSQPTKFNKFIGLDCSMQNFYVDEQGNSPEFKRNYRKSEHKLAKKQRRLARKTKGSKRYAKARIHVAKVHEKIKFKRQDFNHKLSKKLVDENDVIVIENLSLKGMSQSLNLGKSVMDLGYSGFVNMLQYKSKWGGKTLILANKFFASSKTCSVCGFVNNDLMLQEREWVCPNCGEKHHRDQNAAVNLVNYGKHLLVERQKVMPIDVSSYATDEVGRFFPLGKS